MGHTTLLPDNLQHFEPEINEETINNKSLAFAFIGAKLLLLKGGIPRYCSIEELKFNPSYTKFIGRINNIKCFALDLNQEEEYIPQEELAGLRQLYSLLPEHYIKAAIYAFQLILWNRKTKYCGSCGSLTEEHLPKVLVKHCPKCQSEFYPKISPSVIVAVIKDDEILMAQHQRVTNGMYTILAGFVNPGESLEECIHREIKEETGIAVRNIKYFGSQPWPFPDSLMIGFMADFESGILKPDQEEISDLKWFKASEIPEWPDKVSIARSLIDSFINNHQQ